MPIEIFSLDDALSAKVSNILRKVIVNLFRKIRKSFAASDLVVNCALHFFLLQDFKQAFLKILIFKWCKVIF